MNAARRLTAAAFGRIVPAMAPPFVIDADIRRAATLPAAFYRDPAYLEQARQRIFAPSWQLAGDARRLASPGSVLPCSLLEGCLDEPILFTRDAADEIHCVSNVCTHRGNLLVQGEGSLSGLR